MMKMSPRFTSQLLSFPILALLLVTAACTNDKTSLQQSPLKIQDKASDQAKAMAPTAQTTDVCSPDELAPFDRNDGDAVDLDRDPLPRGLYLATVSGMLIEKKNEAAAPSRILIQESAGGKGEITCAEGVDKLGHDFEVTLSGLVKFQLSEKSQASGFVTRQFYFYQDKNGYGAALSNPHLGGVVTKPDDLKHLLRNNGQIVRLSDKSYLVKYLRDFDGVRARLLIRLELIPN